jgi:starch phosphorylase
MVDEAYRDRDGWLDKSILSVARMGFFSTDRVISEYAESIWNVEPVDGFE